MTRDERLRAAQERDVLEMDQIYEAVASGEDPDAAAAGAVGGDFKLSEATKQAIKG